MSDPILQFLKADDGELLPCPMCGGKADYNWDEVSTLTAPDSRAWYIHCAPDDSFKGCIAHDGRFATLREAKKHWNTRAIAEPLRQLLRDFKAMQDALADMRMETYYDQSSHATQKKCASALKSAKKHKALLEGVE